MNNINNLPENYRNISTMRSIYDETVNIHFVAVPNPESHYCDLELWFCESSTGELLEVKKYEEITDEALIQAIARHNEAHPEYFVRNGHPLTNADTPNTNFDSSTNEQEESLLPLESTNASKSLHHPSPEEISAGATKEYEARRAALKELLESGGEIKAIPKTAYYTKEFSDALENVRAEQREVDNSQSSKIPPEPTTTVINLGAGFSRIEKVIGGRTLVSYDEKPHIPFPRKGKSKKPNRNVDTIMGLLARTKK